MIQFIVIKNINQLIHKLIYSFVSFRFYSKQGMLHLCMNNDSQDWRKNNRRKTATKLWGDIFYIIYRRVQFGEFELIDVENEVLKSPITISKESLRVKLSRYCKNGVLDKEGKQKFKLNSERSRDYFDIDERLIAELNRNESRIDEKRD